MPKMCNVELSYLYRDAGNYKNYGSVIFSNVDCIKIERISAALSRNMIDGVFFDASRVGIPDLHFTDFPFDPDLDLTWHEFSEVKLTYELSTDVGKRDISAFLCEFDS